MAEYRILALAALFCAYGTIRAQTKPKANDMVINGESFFELSNIKDELTRLARADGYIGASESFRQIAKSGAVMTGILNQFKSCTPKPIFVISDGGGNDIMNACTPADATCPSIKNALATVKLYFDEMKTSGVKKVMWMRYPDPQGNNYVNLKKNQDIYNPEVEKICKASLEPKCQWIDLRPTWEGHYAQYTTDGIHPTPAGGTATAEAFWKEIKATDFFSLATTAVGSRGNRVGPAFQGQFVSNRVLYVSLSSDRPVSHTLRMTSLSGRLIWQGEARSEGSATAQFPLGEVAPGMYRLELDSGHSRSLSLVMVP
ncbi:MAG: SGNH/GDSL hydrolase family protein [Fibrobacteria bacterium]